MEQTVVDVNGLSRSFGGKSALEGVSFCATTGQVYGLVGANGAGRTTLLKHLLGLLRAGLRPRRRRAPRHPRCHRPHRGR